MKIYIDWDRMEWYTDEKQLMNNLVQEDELQSYSDFLANQYADCLEELLKLSEKEKIEVYEQYQTDLKLEFEDKIKYNQLHYTVLNIDTNDSIKVTEI